MSYKDNVNLKNFLVKLLQQIYLFLFSYLQFFLMSNNTGWLKYLRSAPVISNLFVCLLFTFFWLILSVLSSFIINWVFCLLLLNSVLEEIDMDNYTALLWEKVVSEYQGFLILRFCSFNSPSGDRKFLYCQAIFSP